MIIPAVYGVFFINLFRPLLEAALIRLAFSHELDRLSIRKVETLGGLPESDMRHGYWKRGCLDIGIREGP